MGRAPKRRRRRPASPSRGRARPRGAAPAHVARPRIPAARAARTRVAAPSLDAGAGTVRARPTRAETALLALANEIAALVRSTADPGAALEAAVACVARAYAPESTLPATLFQDWLHTRDDKTARLGLAWGREQVRVGLEEAIVATRRPNPGRPEVPADALAWLLLAACEAIAHEPGDATDRLRTLLDLGRAGAPRA